MPSIRSEPEDAHQVVVRATGRTSTVAGIALTAGAATQLVVDAAAFMAFGADDEHAAGGLARPSASWRRFRPSISASFFSRSGPHPALSPSSFSDPHVGKLPPSWISVPRPAMLVAMVTAPGAPAWATMVGFAVRGSGHSAPGACTLRLLQQLGQVFRLLDADGADQHRLAGAVEHSSIRSDDRFVIAFRRRCGRPRRLRPGVRPPRLSARRRLPACRCPEIRRLPSSPYRSYPPASDTCGSSSGR